MTSAQMLLALLQEGYERKTWHGPNLRQSLKGFTAKQAAWRPAPRKTQYLGVGDSFRLLEICGAPSSSTV